MFRSAFAKWLRRRILTDLRLQVELTSYFHTVDMVNYIWGTGVSGKTNFKGVLRGTDYTAKPSYFAFQRLCALFDSETRKADFVLDFSRVSAPGPVSAESIQSAAFLRRGQPLHVYWYPADLHKDFSLGQISTALWHGAAARLSSPVLADPLTAQAYRLDDTKKSGGFWTLDSLPLTDYPLMITEGTLLT